MRRLTAKNWLRAVPVFVMVVAAQLLGASGASATPDNPATITGSYDTCQAYRDLWEQGKAQKLYDGYARDANGYNPYAKVRVYRYGPSYCAVIYTSTGNNWYQMTAGVWGVGHSGSHAFTVDLERASTRYRNTYAVTMHIETQTLTPAYIQGNGRPTATSGWAAPFAVCIAGCSS